MPDEHDRTVDGLDHFAHDAGVEGDAAKWVRRGKHRVAGALELADHSPEPGRVGEGAVDEDDSRARHHRVLLGFERWLQRRYVTRAERVGPGGTWPGTPPSF